MIQPKTHTYTNTLTTYILPVTFQECRPVVRNCKTLNQASPFCICRLKQDKKKKYSHHTIHISLPLDGSVFSPLTSYLVRVATLKREETPAFISRALFINNVGQPQRNQATLKMFGSSLFMSQDLLFLLDFTP